MQWRLQCSASSCGCISLIKLIARKDPMSEGVASWWLMSWGTAQAGDRASQTGHYGQWWDRDAEQLADTSGRHNLHHSSSFSFSFPQQYPAVLLLWWWWWCKLDCGQRWDRDTEQLAEPRKSTICITPQTRLLVAAADCLHFWPPFLPTSWQILPPAKSSLLLFDLFGSSSEVIL